MQVPKPYAGGYSEYVDVLQEFGVYPRNQQIAITSSRHP